MLFSYIVQNANGVEGKRRRREDAYVTRNAGWYKEDFNDGRARVPVPRLLAGLWVVLGEKRGISYFCIIYINGCKILVPDHKHPDPDPGLDRTQA